MGQLEELSHKPVLSVEKLETSFFTKAGVAKAVDGVSYQIQRGETLGIVGESGCGKSVTSFSVLRLLSHPGRITGGKVLFKGKDLLTVSDDEMRKLRGGAIAMIFQEPMTALNPVLTIGYQIAEQLQAHQSISPQAARKRAVDLLALVGIPSPQRRLDDYPHQLSGGMRQRAMIAMALSCNPELLIADEPTTALDVTIQAQILDLLQKLQEELHMSMQFITHDLGVISELADRILVMYAGTVVEEARTDVLFANPKHPYTVGLMNSMPRMDGSITDLKSHRLPTIPGVVPSLLALPTGCRFQNRCPRALEQCRREAPTLQSIRTHANTVDNTVDGGDDHKLACFNPY